MASDVARLFDAELPRTAGAPAPVSPAQSDVSRLFDEASGRSAASELQDGLTLNLRGAQQLSPDQWARGIEASRKAGLPIGIGSRNPEEAAKMITRREFEEAVRTAPAIGAAALRDPNLSRLMQDDLRSVVDIELRSREFGGVAPVRGPRASFGSVLSGLGTLIANAPAEWASASKEVLAGALGDTRTAEQFARQSATARARIANARPEFVGGSEIDRLILSGAYSGAESAVMNAPGLAIGAAAAASGAGAVGITAASLAPMFAQVLPTAFSKASAQGLSFGDSLAYGLGQAAVETLTEIPAIGFLARTMGKEQLSKLVGGYLFRDIGSEQLATLAGDALDTAFLPGMTWDQYFSIKNRGEAALQTLVATVVGGGALAGVAKLAEGIMGAEPEAVRATEAARVLQDMSKFVAASKVRTRDATTMATLLQSLQEENGAPTTLYLDSNVLTPEMQQQLEALMPSVAEQRDEIVAGGMIELPVGELLTKIAGTPLEQQLVPELRTDENALSVREAETFYQSQSQAFEAAAAQLTTQKAQDAEWNASAKELNDTLTKMFTAVPTVKADQVRAYVAPLQAFYTTLADTLKIAPAEAYSRYKVTVSSQQMEDATLTQAPPVRAQATDFAPGSIKSILEKGDWAILTAADPGAVQASKEQNDAANGQLVAELRAAGYEVMDVVGKYGVVADSYIVLGVTTEQAMAIGNRYGQESVLTREGLVYGDGTVERATGITEHETAPEDFYTEVPGTGALFTVDIDFSKRVPLIDARLEQRVGTRKPTGTKATENPVEQLTSVGFDELKRDPVMLGKVVSAVKTYINFPTSGMDLPAEEAAELFIEEVRGNLLWLFDQVPEAIMQRSRLWYDGGRAIAEQWAEEFGISVASAAAAIATLSPQKDWFANVSLSRRVIDIVKNRADFRWSPEMEATVARIFAEPKFQREIELARGKTFAELPREGTVRALWLRAYDEAHNPRGYPILSPEGQELGPATNLDGAESGGPMWSPLVFIQNAIDVIVDPRIESISDALGVKHKVRNFYNNIFAPDSPGGEVTIDTHAVAAALLRPLAGSDLEVAHNLGGSVPGVPSAGQNTNLGLSGTYALYAEAYRRAAADRGVLAREMQSITWEAVRGLFAAKFKTAKNKAAVARLWQDYKDGKATLDDTRAGVLRLAGGITPPTWFGRDDTGTAGVRPAGDGRGVSGAAGDGAGVRGPGAGAGGARRRAGVQGTSGGTLNQGAQRPIPEYGVARDGATSIVAVHYSPRQQTQLDSSKYGTGMRGAEAARLDRTFDDRLRQRIHFYVDAGAGITPENAVGANMHWVRLNNVYDINEDALGIWASGGDVNARESKIVDAGFDGYVADMGKQRAAVLLGKRTVPVESGALQQTAAEVPVDGIPFAINTPLQAAFPRPVPDGDPLLTDTSTINTPEREALRTKIIDSFFEGKTPTADPVTTVMAGGGGAGKGTIKRALVESGVLDLSNVIDVDPDEIKGMLPEYNELIARGDSRAAATVHEESSMLAERVIEQALAGGFDVMVDKTMAKRKTGDAIIAQSQALGRPVRMFGVTIDPRVAAVRALRRGESSGRFVPIDMLLSAHKGFAGAVSAYLDKVDEAIIFDNTADTPRVIARKDADGLFVEDKMVYDSVVGLAEEIDSEAQFLGRILPEGLTGIGQVRGSVQEGGGREAEAAEGRLGQDREGAVPGERVAPEVVRGQIQFAPDIAAAASRITLLPDADMSTFLHEMGHFMLEVYTDIAAKPNPPANIVADLEALLKWFGFPGTETATPLEQWLAAPISVRRQYHETFARGFEAYLREGNAPTLELQSVFSTFRSWLLRVYKSLTQLNVKLSPEVRGVMDRMLASEQQIDETRKIRSQVPLFASAQELGMSPKEWEDYQALNEAQREEAIAELQARSIRNMQWLSNARSRELRKLQAKAKELRKEMEPAVLDELRQQPVYAARRFLANGILPDGEKVTGAKLSLPALKEMYGEAGNAPWRYLSTGKFGLATSNEAEALHPDVVAEMFGFTSGDHLVRELLAARPEKEEASDIIDRRMIEQYSDLADEAGMNRAVDSALANEARGKFLATELSALSKSQAPVRVMMKAAKDWAARLVGAKKIRDIRPGTYAAAEAKEGRHAMNELKLGNSERAAMHKRNQVLQHYATRTAQDALEEVDKGVAYLKRFDSPSVREKVDQAYLDQIDKILEKFDLRRMSLKAMDQRAALSRFVAALPEGLELDLPDYVQDDAQRVPYRELTLEEFRGVVDSVKMIDHLGRLKEKLLTAKEAREFQAVVDEISTSIDENGTKTVQLRVQRTVGATVKRVLRGYLAGHRKMSSLFREMDGSVDNGPLWRYIIEPMNTRSDMEATMRAEASAKLRELFSGIRGGGKFGGKGMFISELNMSLNREERLAVALNVGNEGNLQRLMNGQDNGRGSIVPWTPAQLDAVLNTLTEADWQFVQGVWDFFESYRPLVAAKEKRVTGVEPEWVVPTPVTTKFGTLRGGYFPIVYDTNQSIVAGDQKEVELAKQQMQGAARFATTRRGHVKERAESVQSRPLLLSLNSITRNVNDVIHDLTWHEWLIDTNRLLKAGPIADAILHRYGPEILSNVKSTVLDIAVGDNVRQTVIDPVLNHLRAGSTIVGMGWSLSTAALNVTGFASSVVRIGPEWMLKGLQEVIGSPAHIERTRALVHEKSEFMANRALTLNREVNDVMNTIVGDRSEAQEKFRASFFWMITKTQEMVDLPTWIGAYNKATSQFPEDDAKAVALADQAVRDAQGAGQTADLAPIQRGSASMRLFTTFYSYMNTQYNLAVDVTKARTRKGEYGMLAVDYLVLLALPIMGTVVLKTLLGLAAGDDWDEEKFAKKLAAEFITYPMSLLVGVRELATAGQLAAGVNEFGGGYSGPAGLRAFSEMTKLGQQIGQGEPDMALLKAAINTGGLLLHFPGGQVARTVEGAVAVAEGEASPLALLFGPPKD